MSDALTAPRYIVDETGKRTQVVLSVRDYKRLLAAWEDAVDARDFAAAKRNAKRFVSADELLQPTKRNRKK
ncbi:MAG: hypothetical protein IT367_00335 [Candidatus Hydrogenedentes bacterium]|nr:hypothetical protein [Candidatus Hydrogenedentota bacterium]